MRLNFRFILILSFFALLINTSCQNEFLEESSQNQEDTLVPNSALTSVMRSASANDGAIDNILDETSCFSVNLPVTIIVNDITITINSLEDLEIIEELYDEFEDDEDSLEFLFPITIILNDYDEIVLESEDDLEAFIEDCTENTSDDDVIECVDFVYPITVSLYDTSFQVIDNVTFNNDNELYDFLEELEDDDNNQVIIASLNFPVTLIYADGSTIEVNSNIELQAAIDAAEEDCYDDDEDSCDNDEIAANLQECYWEIEAYNGDDNYQEIDFMFMEDGTVKILTENDFYEYGTWSMSLSSDNTTEIVIDGLQEFQMFNGSWIIIECDDDELVIVREVEGETTTIVLDQDCEDDLDCSVQEVLQTLQECKWWMGTNLLSPNYSGPLFFEDNNVLLVGYPDNNQLEGTWELALTNTGIYMFLTVGGDYEAIALDWALIECEDDRFKFMSGDHYLVLEQECWEQEGPLGCLEAGEIVLCDENNDGFEIFNLYEGLEEIEECEINNSVAVSYHTSLVDAQSNVNPILNATTYTNMSNSQTIYVRVEVLNNPEQYEILEMGLYLEDCNEDSCSEEDVDSYLMECHWVAASYNGDDQLLGYDIFFNENMDLTIEGDGEAYQGVWSTSENSNNVVTLDISQLSGTLGDLNNQWQVVECTSEQLVLVGNNNVELVLERDCESNNSGCIEAELDAILMECFWVPVNVNGSDDYSESAMIFGDNQVVTIEGFGEAYTTTWSTSGNSENGVWLTISELGGNFLPISGQWLVVECSEEFLHLENGDNTLILDRECN